MAFAVLFKGGGPDGLRARGDQPASTPSRACPAGRRHWASVDGSHRRRQRGASACSSRSGRGSASRPPRCTARSRATRSSIVPRATLIAVVGLGLFYTFVLVDGRSPATARRPSIKLSRRRRPEPLGRPGAGTTSADIRRRHLRLPDRHPARSPARSPSTTPRQPLPLRDRPRAPVRRRQPRRAPTRRTARRTSPRSCRAVITLLLTLGFYFLGTDGQRHADQAAYIYEYGLLAMLGTMAILHRAGDLLVRRHLVLPGEEGAPGQRRHDGRHPGPRRDRHALRRLPALQQPDVRRRCCAADSPFFKAIPWIVGLDLRRRLASCSSCAQGATPSSTRRSAARCWRTPSERV